jgi:uncharacterized protein
VPETRPRILQTDSLDLELPARFGVISDTHLLPHRNSLPSALLDGLRSVTMILHAGDFSCVEVLERLQRVKPTYGVVGNTDPPDLAAVLPTRLEIQLGTRTGLMVHGHNPQGIAAREFVMSAYAAQYDLVIFGHSHMPCKELIGGTLFLNPGSPTQQRRAPNRAWATVDVERDGQIEARIITL